ncbi:hypothetical protein [Lysobacter sp. Hz 25]|uniref:hypothetical protein n=1 Tax=Lysobacter sp. Hz 25 TaxID=3383698 RepID=UPI0038D4D172
MVASPARIPGLDAVADELSDLPKRRPQAGFIESWRRDLAEQAGSRRPERGYLGVHAIGISDAQPALDLNRT